MKIAILGPAPPYRGGISLFALMLARAWREAGHEVAFFNFAAQYPRLLFPGKDQYDSSLNEHEFLNYRTLTPWLPHTWTKTVKVIQDFQPDLLIVSWFLPFFAPAYGMILSKLTGIPKVILAHNVASHEKWALAGYLTRFVFTKADKIAVLSKATLTELIRKLPLSISKQSVLGYHPIYDCYTKGEAVEASNAHNMLFFGLIKPYKGLDVLLDAMPLVLSKIPDAKLVIAGEVYGDSSPYHKQIDYLGIARSVETHFRYISEPEVSSFFSNANLCILPYKSASQSGVIATSYSFGVPVLASDVGGSGEYILPGETGDLVSPNNPVKLAEGIINHFSQEKDMRPSIMEYNKRHSWSSLADLIIQNTFKSADARQASSTPHQINKIMLISYYFPPCGGAAVQRWLRFIAALERRDVQVTVITTKNGDYPYRDESLLKKLSPQLKILRSSPLSFGSLWSLLGQKELPYGSLESNSHDTWLKRALYWIRLNLIVPDMRAGWNPSAYKLAADELKTNNYDVVFTSGPPHSTHFIGMKLKRQFGINWCTDFRDPWSDIYYLKLNPPSSITMLMHKYLERKIIASADCNCIISRSIANALPKGKKLVLYNGFDPADFEGLHYAPADKFRIKYVGQLTAGQDVTSLLEELSKLDSVEDLEFSFIGTRNIPKTNLPLRIIPFLPHREALDELVNAELLVLIINDYEGSQGMLTTKLFEYIGSRTPILCLSKPGGEAEEIILKSQSGIAVNSTVDIRKHIVFQYEQWQQGNYKRSTGNLDFLDVNNQVSKLLSSSLSR
ncbi:MAG: glycosyltransferase [Candidatus Cloacimonetes bacterium]|nr:glycosyltransferase [Candidatus Cloacimonadota bacterium]